MTAADLILNVAHPLPVLERGDIRLEGIGTRHVSDAYLSWLNDAETIQYLELRFDLQSIESLSDFVRSIEADPDNAMFAIVDLADGQHVGSIKLGPIDWNHRFGDIGLLIGEKSKWGRGIATEAIDLVSEYAFEDLKLHKVTASMNEPNIASRKAFERVGFVVEGTRRSQYLHAGNYVGDIFMGLLAGERVDRSRRE